VLSTYGDRDHGTHDGVAVVPLASLVPTRFNVRRYSAGPVEELAALITSQGMQ
jgi:hypothetical protein